MSSHPDIEKLKTRLGAERAKLIEAASRLDSRDMLEPSADGWSGKDILGHVAMAEAVNVRFARTILTEERPEQLRALAGDFPDYSGPFSLDTFNAYMTGKWRDKSLDEVYQALEDTRFQTLAWLDSLNPDDLDRIGIHAAWQEQTVRGIIKILSIHDKMHTQALLTRKRT